MRHNLYKLLWNVYFESYCLGGSDTVGERGLSDLYVLLRNLFQTLSTLSTFIYAMAANPSVQSRAQSELDTVLGPGRTPTFEDRPRLPYIEAVCREVLRWRPAVPLGTPRCSLEDDEYEGHFIPKGIATLLMT